MKLINSRKSILVLLMLLSLFYNSSATCATNSHRKGFIKRWLQNRQSSKSKNIQEISEIIGTHRIELQSQSRTRSMYVHIPKVTKSKLAKALVIVLHGGGGNAKSTIEHYGMNKLADKEGFICIHPNGTGPFNKETLLTWNVGFGFGKAQKLNIDDVSFIENIIDTSVKNLNVDKNRVYLTGMSNGAFMSYWAGACLADKVAAIAPVCGTIGGRAKKGAKLFLAPEPFEPVSVFAINGALDESVPFEGNKQKASFPGTKPERIMISIASATSLWVKANECISEPLISKSNTGNIIKSKFTSPVNKGVEVVLYKILNGAHAWPGAKPHKGLAGMFLSKPTNEINATKEIWNFFKNHPKVHKKLRARPNKWPGHGM